MKTSKQIIDEARERYINDAGFYNKVNRAIQLGDAVHYQEFGAHVSDWCRQTSIISVSVGMILNELQPGIDFSWEK